MDMRETDISLYQALLQLKTTEECMAFFHDLCTPAEITAMNERWRVAQLLDQQQLSYREIHKKTGISLATIGRVARFLSQESYQGYRLVLDKLFRNRNNAFKK
jgi:TrpR-related protein YerC/YecD